MNNFLTRAVCFIVKGGFQVQEFYAFSLTLIYAHTSLGVYITLIKSQPGEKTALDILKSSQELHKNTVICSHKKKEATTNVIKESVVAMSLLRATLLKTL